MKKIISKILAYSLVLASISSVSAKDFSVTYPYSNSNYFSISNYKEESDLVFATNNKLPIETYVISPNSTINFNEVSSNFGIYPIEAVDGYWTVLVDDPVSGSGDVLYYKDEKAVQYSSYNDYINNVYTGYDYVEIFQNLSFELTEEGLYFVSGTMKGEETPYQAVLYVNSSNYNMYRTNAYKTSLADASVEINDVLSNIEAYEIRGNAYFKLSDIAEIFKDTDKEFDVLWNEEFSNFDIIADQIYSSSNKEISSLNDISQVARVSSVLINGEVSSFLTAYDVNGDVFVDIRDLGRVLDYSISWDYITFEGVIDTRI